MVPLEKETNIEVLRHMSLWMRDQIELLAKENLRLKEATEIEKQAWIDQKLKDQLVKLQEQFYGSGREKLKNPSERVVGHSEEQLKLHGEHEAKVEPKKELPLSSTYYMCLMSENELKTESTMRGLAGGAEAWEKVEGLCQTSSEVTVIKTVYQQVMIHQQKYRLKKKYNTTGKEVFLTANGPAKLRSGSKYSIDFAVDVVSKKYEYHLPLERQRRLMEEGGLHVDVKTLYGLCEAVADHCQSVIPMIKKEIEADFCAVHLDETPWKILGSESTSYMWALSNRVGSYYQFEPTRSGKVADEILKDYEGSVVTDGYGGYNKIKKSEKIRFGQCWSHARREFFDLREAYPKEVNEIIPIIDELFAIDGRAKDFDDLARLRKRESRQVITQIWKWLQVTRPKHFPQSGINKAINYCLKFWLELTKFLDDLSIPLTNNDAERALRHVVMGRKNFNGSKTINGADTAAALYTVIESAKKAGLVPSEYLQYLIKARWYNDPVKTPQQLSRETNEPNPRAKFPPIDQWKIH
jgi:transposase-like protein